VGEPDAARQRAAASDRAVTSFSSIARRRVFSNKELMEAAEPQKPRVFASVALNVPPPGLTLYRAGNRHHRASGCGVHIRRRPRAWRHHFMDPWRGCAAVIDAVRAVVSTAGSLPRKSLPHPGTSLGASAMTPATLTSGAIHLTSSRASPGLSRELGIVWLQNW
jgi:hypothetical protein